jgi:hypothetical protein
MAKQDAPSSFLGVAAVKAAGARQPHYQNCLLSANVTHS